MFLYRLLLLFLLRQLRIADTYVASDLVEHREVVPSTKHQLPLLTCYHPAMQESLLKAAAYFRVQCA